jgi:hypothetical protein
MAITRLGPNQDITAAKIAGTINFKNILINGDMSLAQRGTSVSSVTSTGFRTCDRFQPVMNSSGTWTISQSTDVPTAQGFANSFKFDCTTADASPNYLFLKQSMEGQMLQQIKKGTSNAESLTLSFWVKSNKTGTYIAELRDVDNSRTISKSYTIDSASTWEKKTITFDGDTTGTLDNDNNSSLDLHFWLGAGSTYTSGTLATSWETQTNADRAVGQVNLADNTANEWYITGVQLEADTSASDFEFLPYDVNKNRCKRYYQVFNFTSGSVITIGNSYNSTEVAGDFYFDEMRTNPTVTLPTGGKTSGTASYLTAVSGYPTTVGNFGAANVNINNFRLTGSSYVGLTSGGVSWLYSTGNTSLTLDAEL